MVWDQYLSVAAGIGVLGLWAFLFLRSGARH
jgi:hypothetical protein